jgi:GH25 family lysozyme M1 (1,4-beta-N-acetylmuramidase)
MGLPTSAKIRNIAIIIAIKQYERLKTKDKNNHWVQAPPLSSAEADANNLKKFFSEEQDFDEVILLKDQDAVKENIDYFIGTYLPNKSDVYSAGAMRVVIAISAHGSPTTQTKVGGILLYHAGDEADSNNTYKLDNLNTDVGRLANPAITFQVLLLINSCYAGSLMRDEEPPGESALDTNQFGAHAVTAGDKDGKVYSLDDPNQGTMFFSRLIYGVEKDYDEADRVLTKPRVNDSSGHNAQKGFGYVRINPLFQYYYKFIDYENDNRDQNSDPPQYSHPKIYTLGNKPSLGAFFFLRPNYDVSSTLAPNDTTSVIARKPGYKVFRAPESYGIAGIDLSSANGSINFSDLKDDSVDFVYLRAMALYDIDPTFHKNVADAQRNGLYIGAYFPLSFCLPDDVQIDKMHKIIAMTQDIQRSLPLALDVEYSDLPQEKRCAAEKPISAVTDSVRHIVAEYTRATGKIPLIYGGSYIFSKIVTPEMVREPYNIWYRDYEIDNDQTTHLVGHRPWTIWQHSSAKLSGTQGKVDRNVFFGTKEEFEFFVRGKDPVNIKVNQPSVGTGVFVNEDGYIVTAAHVVTDCDAIRVRYQGGNWGDAQLIASNPDSDVALLRVPQSASPPRPGSLRFDLKLGEDVSAFGHDNGGSDVLSKGQFVAQSVGASLYTSVIVYPGFSGAPLLDNDGNLVGVVSGGSVGGGVDTSFAVAASVVANFLRSYNVQFRTVDTVNSSQPRDLVNLARSITVGVECQTRQ